MNPAIRTGQTQHQSAREPGVWYWAEKNPGPVESWSVIVQAQGGPATEACDDWLATFKDADEIARMMASGELPSITL